MWIVLLFNDENLTKSVCSPLIIRINKMYKSILSIGNIQLFSFTVVLIAIIVKIFFYFRIKTKKSKQLGEFLKSFKTWFKVHDLHDADTNLSRQEFMQISNFVNIIWWVAMILLVLSSIMNSPGF